MRAPAALALTLGIFVGTTCALRAGVYLLDHGPETHCRIEVYNDGSAEPTCDAGYMPTHPITDWPIVRVGA